MSFARLYPRDDAGGETSFFEPRGSWADAWVELAGSTSDVGLEVDNSLARENRLNEAYDRRIKAIHTATGVQLDNPLKLENLTPSQFPVYDFFFGSAADDRLIDREEEFAERLAELAEKFPDHADLFTRPVRDDANTKARAAVSREAQASANPNLGFWGRLSAQLAGGLYSAAHDPTQWGFAIATGGFAAGGKTVASRIGRTLLMETGLNAGLEVPLQIKAGRSRLEAGIDFTAADFARNVVAGGAFGGLFGGGVQAGREIAGLIRARSGIAENSDAAASLERTMLDAAVPGDVEKIATATGVELSPETIAELQRGFAEDAMDDALIAVARERTGVDQPPGVAEQYVLATERWMENPDEYAHPEFLALANADDQFYMDRYADLEAAEMKERFDADYGPPPAKHPLDAEKLAPQGDFADLRPDTAETNPALQRAIDAAGEIKEPKVDGNGNTTNAFELVGVADEDGNFYTVTPKQAIEMADQQSHFADLIEACKI